MPPAPARPAPAQIDGLLAKYSPDIAALGRAARQRMRRALPGWSEFVYDNYNALAFGFAPTTRPSDAVFSIVLYPKWVRLFFLQNGPDLQDPEHLLSGTGKRVRSLVLPTAVHLETPAVRALMRQAISLADARAVLPGRVQTEIRSVSARQRPRRPRA